MEPIITAATVATMFFNVASSPVNNGYNYNATMDGDKIVSVNVYNKDGKYLNNKLQYDYTYDAQNRLTKQVAMRYNSVSGKWENDYVLVYSYEDNGYTLERHDWNKKTMAYNEANEMMVYQMISDNVMAVNTYKKTADDKDFAKVESVTVMNPQHEILMGMAENLEK